MIGQITEINKSLVTINLAIDISQCENLVNKHLIFSNNTTNIVGEIINVNKTTMYANIVGEISENKFTAGFSTKPSFKSQIRLINLNELELILGGQTMTLKETYFGTSNIYQNFKIHVNKNDFFSNHFAIIGNSGSGKSSTVSSIIQKLFIQTSTPPLNANMFFFDAYGEYTRAFSGLNLKNPNLNYKTYTTNTKNPDTDILKIPVWLLDVDDLALLLDVNTANQLPILEKTLKLVKILSGDNQNVIKRKNDIIARALQDILLSGDDSTKIRDQVIAVLTKFNTTELNLDSKIIQPGYTRNLKQCLLVDKTGKMQEMELVVEFVRTYIMFEEEEIKEEELSHYYSLKDLENAMEFALISEGVLKSSKVFDYANVLSVRLHTLINSEHKNYFDYPTYVTKEMYIEDLLRVKETGKKAQIVNFNINYIDDRLAKVITKILSRMLFKIASDIKPRGSKAFHIIIEEAHRYVIKDNDVSILGYNIFERITKEGRKYGLFVCLITQRPSELSDTAISQCSNFLILRTMHPKDLTYLKEMIPNVTEETIESLKGLKPGNCIAFGSAFKVPTFFKVDLPNPQPLSNNVNLDVVWNQEVKEALPQYQTNDIEIQMDKMNDTIQSQNATQLASQNTFEQTKNTGIITFGQPEQQNNQVQPEQNNHPIINANNTFIK